MASKTQKVKFEAYLACSSDGDLIDISDLLKKISNLDHKRKTVTQYGVPTRLDKLHEVTLNSDTIKQHPNLHVTYFHMSKLRDDGIALTKEGIDELKDLDLDKDEYIAEDINCFFDNEICCLFVQRNFHSLSITGIEYYLKNEYEVTEKENKNFNESEFKELDLNLLPVPNKEIIKKIEKIKNVRSINLSFASSSLPSLPKDILHLLGNFKEIFQNMGGLRIGIKLSAGDRKDPSLNVSNVKKVSKLISQDKTLFSSAIVNGKDDKMPVEKFDLLNGKLYTDYKFSSVKDEDGKTKKMHLSSSSVEEQMKLLYFSIDPKFGVPFREVIIRNI